MSNKLPVNQIRFVAQEQFKALLSQLELLPENDRHQMVQQMRSQLSDLVNKPLKVEVKNNEKEKLKLTATMINLLQRGVSGPFRLSDLGGDVKENRKTGQRMNELVKLGLFHFEIESKLEASRGKRKRPARIFIISKKGKIALKTVNNLGFTNSRGSIEIEIKKTD